MPIYPPLILLFDIIALKLYQTDKLYCLLRACSLLLSSSLKSRYAVCNRQYNMFVESSLTCQLTSQAMKKTNKQTNKLYPMLSCISPSSCFLILSKKSMKKHQPEGIVYTTIAREGVVLVEQINRSPQFTHTGNFMQVVHILLPKLPKEGRMTFHYDRFVHGSEGSIME